MAIAAAMGRVVGGSPLLDRLLFGVTVTTTTERTRTSDDPLEKRAVAAVKAGDAEAYDYLVAKYMKRVVSIAWNCVRNTHDAEDLAQEAFVKAYRNIGRFRSDEPFGPWIYRIVTNLALDTLKHRSRFRHEELADARPAGRRDEADLPALTNEIAARIDAALERLPEHQRAVARLNLVEGFDHAEVAAMMGLAEGTVRSHLSLARRKLRELLSDLYEETDD